MYIEMNNKLKSFYGINGNVTQLEIENADTNSLGHGQYVKKLV